MLEIERRVFWGIAGLKAGILRRFRPNLCAQQHLSAAAEMALTLIDNEKNLFGRDKAIVRLLAEGAIKELPLKIHDPANYPQIKRDLRLLKSSLVLLP